MRGGNVTELIHIQISLTSRSAVAKQWLIPSEFILRDHKMINRIGTILPLIGLDLVKKEYSILGRIISLD